mmetsp:Transcript_26117/g.53482  ORF Transcript_26117/g.53482 Transcript_26117/m.53482 type:complete len:278 (+) Transcript_26117:1107-1940(+)
MGDGTEHDTPSTDLGPIPHRYVPQHGRPGSDEHVPPHLRMSISRVLPRPPQRHTVQQRRSVPDRRRFSDDHPGRVIDHDTLPDRRQGVYVHPERPARLRLQPKRHEPIPPPPSLPRDAVTNDRGVPLEEQYRFQQRFARGIAAHVRQGVLPHRIPGRVSHLGVLGVAEVGNEAFEDHLGTDVRVRAAPRREAMRDAAGHGLLERVHARVEDRALEETSHGGFRLEDREGLGPEAVEQGISSSVRGGDGGVPVHVRARGGEVILDDDGAWGGGLGHRR